MLFASRSVPNRLRLLFFSSLVWNSDSMFPSSLVLVKYNFPNLVTFCAESFMKARPSNGMRRMLTTKPGTKNNQASSAQKAARILQTITQ